jgi:hypothetical protein
VQSLAVAANSVCQPARFGDRGVVVPSISFKKDEVRLLSAILRNYALTVEDQVAAYAKRLENGETLDFYDQREYVRLAEKAAWLDGIFCKLSKAIYPAVK